MNKEQEIVKIDIVRGARVQNLHNGFTFPRQNVMKVYFRDGSYRVLDLFSKLDITDIDYFKVIEDNVKVKNVFENKRGR